MRPGTDEYKYSIDQCSVEDKERLVAFREKRSVWLDWLEGDAHHDIRGQIHSMMWNDAAYRSFNEARRFASKKSPTAAVNGMLGEFVDRGYLSTQILDACKITDRSSSDPRKGVVSLRRLFDDIKDHRQLLTREFFVSYDGLPYDYAAVQQGYFASLSPEQLTQPHWLSTKGPDAWAMSERLHQAFDGLSGVTADARQRTDLIHENVFATVEAWFDAPALKKLRTLRNKFVGHAADEVSRRAASVDRFGVTLDEIAEAQRTIVTITTAIDAHILYDRALGSVVPTPQFDVYEHLELPYISAKHTEEMGEWWHTYARERDDWLRERVNLVTGEVTSDEPSKDSPDGAKSNPLD